MEPVVGVQQRPHALERSRGDPRLARRARPTAAAGPARAPPLTSSAVRHHSHHQRTSFTGDALEIPTTRERRTMTAVTSTEKLGCDTSDMLTIHALFRRAFTDAPVLVRGVADGDTARMLARRRPRPGGGRGPAPPPRGRGPAALGHPRAARAGVCAARRPDAVPARRHGRAAGAARRPHGRVGGVGRRRRARRRGRAARRRAGHAPGAPRPGGDADPADGVDGDVAAGVEPAARARHGVDPEGPSVPAARLDPRGRARRRARRLAADQPARAGPRAVAAGGPTAVRRAPGAGLRTGSSVQLSCGGRPASRTRTRRRGCRRTRRARPRCRCRPAAGRTGPGSR